MTANPAIALGHVTRSPRKPSAPKPPVGYGKVLQEHREALGLSRDELAKHAGIDSNTLRRNEIGDPLRSVKGANAIRDALIALGRSVPPVPVGDDWQPTVIVPAPTLDPADEIVRRNLVRFREAVGMDQFAAAFASGLTYEALKAYELGERIPSTATLASLAATYGCNTGAFLDDTENLPTFDATRQAAFHYGGPGTPLLTDEQRRLLAEIAEDVAVRAAKARAQQKTQKKRR